MSTLSTNRVRDDRNHRDRTGNGSVTAEAAAAGGRALRLLLLAILSVGVLLPGSLALAQDGDIPPADDTSNESDVEVPAGPKYDEELILAHFHASKAEFDDEGRLHLTYTFSTKDSNLLNDWSPELKDTKRRIRWSQGYEGTWTTVEDGLIIADQGTFIHSAEWNPDVEISVDYLSMSASGKKDFLATFFAWDRGRKVVGAHYGTHCLRFDRRMRPRGRPIPARALTIVEAEQRRSFGMRLEAGLAKALHSGSVSATTEGEEKFTEDLGAGRVGLAWNGRINGFIFSIEIVGTLSPEYLEEHVPGAVLAKASAKDGKSSEGTEKKE